MAGALVAGVILARRKRYRAHGICQTTVLFLNLLMIGLVMWPSFRRQVNPRLPKLLHKAYYAAPMIHAALGITAELLGLYIVLLAGTDVLPAWLRFRNWKLWMLPELGKGIGEGIRGFKAAIRAEEAQPAAVAPGAANDQSMVKE